MRRGFRESLIAVSGRRAQPVRFILVGIVNTIFGYSVFAFMTWLGLHYTVAIGVATVLGVLFNFKSTGVIVFGSHDNLRLFRFILVYCVVYVANVLGVFFLLRLPIGNYVAGLLMVLPLALLSYKLNQLYVFKNE
jgi:putative flippase GtrA